MALQNIGAANSDDAFYRYKMPKMITKIEGRGNGIKTNIVNMVDIAKALARPASYITKYFGCELGAQSKFDERTGTSLVNGAHETAKLAGLLENFIKKFVQCYGCRNPETEINITKTEMITLKCAACGFVSDVDMRDKLTTFVVKNPPEQKKGSKDKKAMRRAEKERMKEGEAADEEMKKMKKDAKKKTATATSKAATGVPAGKKKSSGAGSPTGSQNGDNDTADDDDDVEWQTDTSAEAARQRIQEQLSAVTAEMVMLSTIEEEEKKSKLNGNGAPKSLLSEIKGRLAKGATPGEMRAFLGSAAGTPEETMTAFFEGLFDGVGKGFAKEVRKRKDYLAAAVQDDEGKQMLLLSAVEIFCGKASGEAVKEVALVLKTMYDLDLLDEEIVVVWFEKGCGGESKSAQLWKNVRPFVEWLQNAESESE